MCERPTLGFGRIRGWLWPGALSAAGLAARGVLIAAVFVGLHLAGLRPYTSVVSGTSPSGAPLDAWDCMLGGAYVLFWMAFVVATPILVLAGGLLWAWERKMGGKLFPPPRSGSDATGQAK